MIIKHTSPLRTGNLSPPIIMCQESFEKHIMRKAILHTLMHYEQEIFSDFMQNGI